jgi:hypothetical protein
MCHCRKLVLELCAIVVLLVAAFFPSAGASRERVLLAWRQNSASPTSRDYRSSA